MSQSLGGGFLPPFGEWGFRDVKCLTVQDILTQRITVAPKMSVLPVVGCMMASKDVDGLIPRACEYITLSDKRDLTDVIKDLETGRISWIIQWT